MKTIKVFVSSPGDVQAERTIADRLIRTIAEELAIPVTVQYSNLLRNGEAGLQLNSSGELESGELILCPYFWEYQRFAPEFGYQDQIPNTAQFDLVISILWSRLGTKLHPRFHMPDGSEPRSGTEFEIAWAKEQRAKTPGVPALHVYRNRSQPNPPLDPPEKRDEFFRQWDSLKGFFESWEKDSEGQFVGAFNNYNNLEEFERLFREHFRDFLSTQISGERNRRWLAQRSQVRRWKQNPFRGLQIFEFEHAPIFAGRTLAIDGVLTALTQQAKAGGSFVLVLGASGSGKSSLVRAGVLPLLVEPGVIEGIGLWRRSVMRPGAGGSQSDVFDALAAGLLAREALPELADLESKEPVKDLAVELRANPQGVAGRVKDKLNQVASEYRLRQEQRLRELESDFREQKREADAANARLQREKLESPRARLVLVVDQLEELFTSGFSEELQLKFVNSLAVLARSGRVFVLVTLRNDFYARYQQFTDLVELTKPSGKYDLQPPTLQELGRMIRLPAQAAGLEFERDEALGQTLDEALRDGAAADPQALPLLEHVLTRLYELQEKRGDRILSWSDYRELGEMNGALANHAEEVFGTLRPDEQAAFPLAMGYLVTLGQGEEEVPNRRTAPYHDFLGREDADHKPRAGAKGFVDRFIEKRLLIADTDPHGEITVSVAHEALLREWGRVKSWLAGNREFLRMRDRLHSSLRLWLSRGKQKDDLLGPGLPVAEGERLVKEFAPSLSREEIDYIKVSTAERKRREHARARKFQVAAAVLFVLLCAASVGAYLGITGRTEAERQREAAQRQTNVAVAQRAAAEEQARIAESRRLAAESSSALIKHPQRSVLLAVEAVEAGQSLHGVRVAAAEQSLRDALASIGGRPLVAIASAANAVEISPDNHWLVSGSDDGTARLWNLTAKDPAANPVILRGHEDAVNAVGISPNNHWLVTGSDDKTARLWDLRAKDPAASPIVLRGHEGAVWAVGFSPDNHWVVTGGNDKTARLWDLRAKDPAASPIVLRGHENTIGAVQISPDNHWVVTGSYDKTARLWDLSAKDPAASPVILRGDENGVSAIGISPDSRWLVTGSLVIGNPVTGSLDKTVRLWDLRANDPAANPVVLRGHEKTVSVIGISPDSHWLATGSFDKTARLWDLSVKDPAANPVVLRGHEDTVSAVRFSPDNHWLVTGSDDNTARLWDLSAKDPAASPVVLRGHDGPVGAAGFSPDKQWLLSGSLDGTARLWDLSAKDAVASPVVLRGHDDDVLSMAISPDDHWLATASFDKTARLWDLSAKDPAASPIVLRGHEKAVLAVGISPDNHWVVTGSADKTARLWDLSAKDPASDPVVLRGHENEVLAVGISPDNHWVVTGSADKTARLWDLSAKDPAANPVVLRGHEDEVLAVGISPDNHWVVTGSQDKTARLWDLTAKDPATNSVVLRGHEDMVSAVRFSPDNHWVVTGSFDKTARLWDLTAKDPAANPVVLRGHENTVSAIGISPDNHWVVTGSLDKTARLWDLSAKDPAASPIVLRGHESAVYAVGFSPDKHWVVTGSQDKTARLWDLTAKDPAANSVVLRGHENIVYAVGFTPDNRWLVTGSLDKTARLWLLQIKDLLNLADVTVGRNFSAEEWKLYFPDEPYHKTFPDLPGPD